MHPRLAETMDYVEDKRKELLQSFAGVPSDTLCRRSSADGWSVAEILDHLSMVEAGVARLITKRADRAREAGLSEERSSTPTHSWASSISINGLSSLGSTKGVTGSRFNEHSTQFGNE